MSLGFSIAPASAVPIYRQITRQIRSAVLHGRLRPGDQLPAIRVLAEELVINPNTVARAYQDLVREGIAETRSGVGLFVLRARPTIPAPERQRLLTQAVDEVRDEALSLAASLTEVQALLEKRWNTGRPKGKSHE
jgi:GntR family transcriptional regulator